MTDATHTRDSDDWREALEGCVRSLRKGDLSEWELHLIQRRVDYAMRRISTSIPLTPSDEMVGTALNYYHGRTRIWGAEERLNMRAALQAALNLMGGKK